MSETTDALYDEVVVDKPWGHEYLMFRNQDVALWYLFLRRGESTSLHCHPRKKTGFVVLSGSVSLRFLNNSSALAAPANVMLRAGLFHQSAADLGSDVALIEVESPVNKLDLIRLDDSYGREKAGYEPMTATRPWTSSCLRLVQPPAGQASASPLHGRILRMCGQTSAANFVETLKHGDIAVILEGGLFAAAGEPILTAGDTVSAATLMRLSRSFASPSGIVALVVTTPTVNPT